MHASCSLLYKLYIALYYLQPMQSSKSSALLALCNTKQLPPGITKEDLADNFNSFFVTNIAKIRNQLENTIVNIGPLPMELVRATSILDSFQLSTPQDVAQVILLSPSKSCESDSIPTDLLKAILPVILNLLTELVSRLLQTWTFPNNLREALVKLLLKIILELLDKNYNPVSNLPFIGKILEWVATNQLMDHIYEHNQMEPFQAAYRSDHSTETALLKVKADIH